MDICGYQYFLIFLHTRRYCEINLYSHILFQLIQLPWARTCLFLFGRNGVHLKAVRPCAARVLQWDAVCNWSKPQENCFPNNRDMAFSCGTWWLETARYLKTNLVWPYWMTDWLAPVWTPSIHFGYHPSARFQQTSYLDTSQVHHCQWCWCWSMSCVANTPAEHGCFYFVCLCCCFDFSAMLKMPVKRQVLLCYCLANKCYVSSHWFLTIHRNNPDIKISGIDTWLPAEGISTLQQPMSFKDLTHLNNTLCFFFCWSSLLRHAVHAKSSAPQAVSDATPPDLHGVHALAGLE